MGDFILEQVNSDDKIVLKRDETYTYGREKNNEIVIVSPLISRKHCVIIVTAASVKIIDSGSSNGVFVNGIQIRPHTPINVKVNDTIGIACGDFHNIPPGSFVYRLKRYENVDVHKRKLVTDCTEIPSKIPKTEPIYSPEIVIIDDDDTPVQNEAFSTMLPKTSNIHTPLIEEEKNAANNDSSMEIELIDLEEVESTEGSNALIKIKQNNPQITITEIPQELVNSNAVFLKQEFNPANFTSHQNMEENNSDPLEINIHHPFIKCEPTLLEDQDMFEEFSSPLSTSNIKQEVISSDLDYLNGHYSQTELICLSDDEEEEEINFPRSQLFDEITIDDKIHNDGVTSIKQEPIIAHEESIDLYSEPDDIPLVELTDEENDNDDHRNDEGMKVWLRRILRSELEQKNIQIKVQPPEESEEKEEFIIKELEESEEEQENMRAIEYGQLNDVINSKVHPKCINENHSMEAIEEMVDKIKECGKKSEDMDNQMNNDIQNIKENNITEVAENIIDSNVSNMSDAVMDVNKTTTENNDMLNDEKFKNNKLKKKKKKKEKSVKVRNRQKSINQSNSTSNKTLNLQTEQDSDDVSSEEVDKDTECHDPSINNSLHNKLDNIDEINETKPHNEQISKYTSISVDQKEDPPMKKCVNIWNKKEKVIEQVDAPFFPKGDRRGVSINITASTSGILRDHSASSDDDIFTSNKTIILPPKHDDKQTVNDSKNKKEKRLKRLRRKFGDYTPSNTQKQKLLNEQRKKIKEERSERLKQLQNKSDEMKISEFKEIINKRINKPKVKISEKNRGAFLTPDETSNDSVEINSNDSVFESLIVPKIQELQQNTAAQDLYDVISSSSVSFSHDKALKSETNDKQRVHGKENHNETEQLDMNREMLMKIEKNIKVINNINKIKPIITSNVSINVPNIQYYKEQRDIKKIIPLRGILRDLRNNGTAVKKKVRFNDKTKIQIYLIDEGNKIEMKCTQKDMKIGQKFSWYDVSKAKVDCPKVELFLYKVFQWRPVWINEQRERQIPPPIVDETDISSVSLTYPSYVNYYKTMSTLMLLETWYIISKDYEIFKKRPVLFSSVVEKSVSQTIVDSSSNLKITTFMIEALITEQILRHKHYPVYGDLVMLELAGIHNGKTKFTHVFAYITALNHTLITPTTRYNSALNKLTTNPHTLVTYTMMTKALPFTLQAVKPGRLKTVIYLRSHMRMVQALHYLPQSPLLQAILHPTPEAYKLPFVSHASLTLVTKDKLNEKQRESVFRIAEAVVNQKPGIFLVKGPPGTGKSKVIINLITEILYGNRKNKNQKLMKILVCAPSNAAIDEIVSRLKTIRSNVEDPAYKFKMVRIGRLEAVSPAVRSFHVSELAKRDVDKTLSDYHAVKNSSESIEKQKEILSAHIKALKEEHSAENIPETQKQYLMRKLTSFRAKYDLFSNCHPSTPLNSKFLAKIHQAAENTILAGANIIACTLSSCYTNQMESIFGKSNGKISVCIVDEATQSSEPETLIPLMLGVTSLVLVGDPNQLPATVISQQAKKLGFDKSLFARIHSVFNGNPQNPIIMLDTQYRMANRIMLFPNQYFYNNAIISRAPKERLPFHFYKVFNLSSNQDDSNKFSNTDEAKFVANLVYTMIMNAQKIKTLGIGIITPYNDQRMLISQKISERMEIVSEEIRKKTMIEVNTVDSFQGQERDVIIMSCVRSNGIGFLSDRQRLCVALTRAKFSLVLCGNFKTFEKDPMWFELLQNARERNIYINLDYQAESEEIKEFIIR